LDQTAEMLIGMWGKRGYLHQCPRIQCNRCGLNWPWITPLSGLARARRWTECWSTGMSPINAPINTTDS